MISIRVPNTMAASYEISVKCIQIDVGKGNCLSTRCELDIDTIWHDMSIFMFYV